MSAPPRDGDREARARAEKQEEEEKMAREKIKQLMDAHHDTSAKDPLFLDEKPDTPYKWFKGEISCFLTTRGLFVFPHDESYCPSFYLIPFNDTRAKGNTSSAGGPGHEQAIFSGKETYQTNLDGPVKFVCDFGDWFVISSGTQVAVVELSGESKIESRLSKEMKTHSLMCHYRGREGSVSIVAFVKFVGGQMEVYMFSVSDKREFSPWPEYPSGKPAHGLVLKHDKLNGSTTNVFVSTDCIIVHYEYCIELITLGGRDLAGNVLTERRVINRLPISNMFAHFVTPSEVLMVQDSMVTMISLTSRSRVRWLLLDNVFKPEPGSIQCFMIKNRLYVQVHEHTNLHVHKPSKLRTFVISAGNKELRVIDKQEDDVRDDIKDVFISQVIRLEREKNILRIANKVFTLSYHRKFSYVAYCPEVKSDGKLAAEMAMNDLIDEAISIIHMEHARIRRKEVFRECMYCLWTDGDDTTRIERRTRAIQLLSNFGKVGRKADRIFGNERVKDKSFLQICQSTDNNEERCGWVGDIATRFLIKRPNCTTECPSSFEVMEDRPNELWGALKELLRWARHRCAAALKLEEMKMIDRWLARFYIYFHERSNFKALLLEKSRNKLVECDKFGKSVEDFFGLETSDGDIDLHNSLLAERRLLPEYAIYCAFRNPYSKHKESGESDLKQKTKIAWKIFSFFVHNAETYKLVDFNADEEAVNMFSNDQISSLDFLETEPTNWSKLPPELGKKLLLPTCVCSSNTRCDTVLWAKVFDIYTNAFESEQQKFGVEFFTKWLVSVHEHYDPNNPDSKNLLRTLFDKLLEICQRNRIQESDEAIAAIVAVKPTIEQSLSDPEKIAFQEKIANDFQALSKAFKIGLYSAMGQYGDWIEELRISNKSDADILTMCLESENPEAAFQAYFEKCNGSDPRRLFSPMVQHIDIVNLEENLSVISRTCPRLTEVSPLLLSIGQATAYQAQMETLLRAVTKAEAKEHEWDVPDASGPAESYD